LRNLVLMFTAYKITRGASPKTLKQMANFSIIDTIKRLSNLKATEKNAAETSDKMLVIEGETVSGKVIVSLHFSIAPSLQSMLSRRGQIYVSASVYYNGASVYYEAELSRDQMKAIGDYLSQEWQKETDKIRGEAYNALCKELAFE
jgi:hypothetical protein